MTDAGTGPADAVHLSERIAAPKDAVFEFLVDQDKLLRWIGASANIDPMPGGVFWLNVTGDDIASGTYVEVEAPNRVAFTWGWEGNANVPPGSSTVTITLTTDGDHTVVDLYHAGLPDGDADEHAMGWTHFLGQLTDQCHQEGPR